MILRKVKPRIKRNLMFMMGFIVLGFALLVFIAQMTIIAPRFYEIEDRFADNKLRTAENIINSEINRIANLTQDWAVWDDSYEFAKDWNGDYSSSNLTDETFENITMNLLIIADTQGNIIWGTFRDYSTYEEFKPFVFSNNIIPANHPLLQVQGDSKKSGIMKTKLGPMAVASHSILNSHNEGPARGCLIMGRLLDQKFFSGIEIFKDRNISITDISNMNSSKVASVIKRCDPPCTGTNTRADANTLCAYKELYDIYGKPTYALSLEIKRDIYMIGKALFTFVYITTFLLGVCIVIGLHIFMDKSVFNPLNILGEEMDAIGDSNDLTLRLKDYKDDEIGQIAFEFNEMLGRLQYDNEVRKRAEDDLLTANRMTDDINARLQISLTKSQLLAEEAKTANRAKTRFLTQMSHELRTPLNAIMGFGQVLEEEDLPEEQAQYVELIKLSSEKLLELISEILEYTQIESEKIEIEIEDSDINGILRCLEIDISERAKQKKLRFEIICDPDVPKVVKTDSKKLYQCLLSLLSNAVVFTDKGSVVLTVSKVEDVSTFIRFDVADTGVGIPKGKLDNIFESFTQADEYITRNHGGPGLGLTITKSLIDLLGGKIFVSSELGKGSVFTIVLPVELSSEKEKQIVSNWCI